MLSFCSLLMNSRKPYVFFDRQLASHGQLPGFRRLGYGCCFSNWASLRRQLYGSLWLSILLHQVASTRVCSTHAAISYPYLCNSTNRLRFIWLPLKQQSVVILENSCQV